MARWFSSELPRVLNTVRLRDWTRMRTTQDPSHRVAFTPTSRRTRFLRRVPGRAAARAAALPSSWRRRRPGDLGARAVQIVQLSATPCLSQFSRAIHPTPDARFRNCPSHCRLLSWLAISAISKTRARVSPPAVSCVQRGAAPLGSRPRRSLQRSRLWWPRINPCCLLLVPEPLLGQNTTPYACKWLKANRVSLGCIVYIGIYIGREARNHFRELQQVTD